jgi:hypothetical protein
MDDIIEKWSEPSFPGEIRRLMFEHPKMRAKMESLEEKIDKGIYISSSSLFSLFGREFNEALLAKNSAKKVLEGMNEFGDDIENFVPIGVNGNNGIKKGSMSEKNRKLLIDYIAEHYTAEN